MRDRRFWPILSALALIALAAALVYLGAQSYQPASPQPDAAGWYEVYFTAPGTDVPPAERLDGRFVTFVDASRRSLDVAAYEFDLMNVADALSRARDRGVAVRMVLDSDTLEDQRDVATRRAVERLRTANIPLVGDDRPAIMHHKFAVRDGEEVWTGSWNLTERDAQRYNNNAARIRSPALAARYAEEFELMFTERRFGPSKRAVSAPSRLVVDGVAIESLFAPEEPAMERLIARVSETQRSIHFLAFAFTHDRLGRTVRDRAQAGAEVAGVFERTGSETRFSEYGPMHEARLGVFQDGNPALMHHKVFILDGQAVVFGSFNFSENATRSNDENLLIVDHPPLAGQFEAEFQRVAATARNAAPARTQTPDRLR